MTIPLINPDAVNAGAALNGLDIALLCWICLGWPIYSFYAVRAYPVERLREMPNARMNAYTFSMIQLWTICLAILAIWSWADRDFKELGFQHALNGVTGIVWGLVVIGIALTFRQYHRVKTHPPTRDKLARELDAIGDYTKFLMPESQAEYGRAMMVALTAGITEEIIFRGYLIWALSLWIHPWAAGLASVTLFVILHLYQNKTGLIQVALFAAITTGLFLACGSLYPVIALHIMVDVINLSLGRHVLYGGEAGGKD